LTLEGFRSKWSGIGFGSTGSAAAIGFGLHASHVVVAGRKVAPLGEHLLRSSFADAACTVAVRLLAGLGLRFFSADSFIASLFQALGTCFCSLTLLISFLLPGFILARCLILCFLHLSITRFSLFTFTFTDNLFLFYSFILLNLFCFNFRYNQYIWQLCAQFLPLFIEKILSLQSFKQILSKITHIVEFYRRIIRLKSNFLPLSLKFFYSILLSVKIKCCRPSGIELFFREFCLFELERNLGLFLLRFKKYLIWCY